MDKKTIRSEMRTRRKAVTREARNAASHAICERIVSDGRVKAALGEAGTVAVYLCSPDEIDLERAIRAFLARGMRVVVPQWNGETYQLALLKSLNAEDLRTGPMHILEPREESSVAPEEVSVWIVPGLAFTRDGGRLGYGGGWYDRLLAHASPTSVKLGVAYGFQVFDQLPEEAHDCRLSSIMETL